MVSQMLLSNREQDFNALRKKLKRNVWKCGVHSVWHTVIGAPRAL